MVPKITAKSIIFVRTILLFALFIVIIGLLFNGYDIYKWFRFRMQGIQVEAVIEKCSKQKISNPVSPWKGIMRWELQYTGIYGFDVVGPSGDKTHCTGIFSFKTDYYYDWETDPQKYKVGSILQVIYLPSNPEVSMPLEKLTTGDLIVLLAIFVVLLTVASFLMIIYYFFYRGKDPLIQRLKG
ncbi:MAG: DUF3592 domain-containing protein [Nitrospirota bacterium]